MEIDFTSAYLHYPLPQCSKIVTPIIFSISYELFRLPSAKVPQDYQITQDFCLEKLIRNNEPFLDTLYIRHQTQIPLHLRVLDLKRRRKIAKSLQDGVELKPYLKCVVLEKEMPIYVIMSCITIVLPSVLIYHLAGSLRIIQVTWEKLPFHTDT